MNGYLKITSQELSALMGLRYLQQVTYLLGIRPYPDAVRLDNGPEFISEALANWAVLHGVKLQFIQPGKPIQNSFIERFNRTFREEVLDFYLFKNLNEVRQISEQWLMQYNEERPHESLGNMSPNQYKLKNNQSVDSTNLWH